MKRRNINIRPIIAEKTMFVDYAPCKNCKNPHTFGMICVKCGQCGRKFEGGRCTNINEYPADKESAGR